MSKVDYSLAKLLDRLEQANGDFVAGVDLGRLLGVPVNNIGNFVRALRAKRPDLVIQGVSGRGYRLALPGQPVPPPEPRKGGVDQNVRLSQAQLLMQVLPATIVEPVRTIAQESGEVFEQTFHRLISYGVEVHRDLVDYQGLNPLGLPAPGHEGHRNGDGHRERRRAA